ncbi:WXG100 family type VII secretion target [Actinoplanes sp. CA-030573]|uniref:WXG100 family type VII secretion target n=1 Tax=Actinoplanes sp. CA-030573 TaxID=3239898 RepID=UPI003D8E7F6E
MSALTDYTRFSHHELVRMVNAGSPEVLRRTGDAWHDAGRNLHDGADAIADQLARFAPFWTGGAADQYKQMMSQLADGITSCANAVLAVRDQVYRASEDLRTAQSHMPAAVVVSETDPTVVALAAGTLPTSTAAAIWEATDRAGRSALVQKINALQQQTAASTAANSEAVRVMTTLATNYTDTEASFPQTPKAEDAPVITTQPANSDATVLVNLPPQQAETHQQLSLTAAAALEGKAAPQQPNALFGSMYSAGLLAVAGAVGAGIGSAAQRLKTSAATKAAAKELASKGAKQASMPSLGGGGGPAPAPVGDAVLSAGSSSGSAAASTIAAAAGSSVARSAGTSMMPMMPIGAMGAMGAMGAGTDGMAGGRRLPPWLVEDRKVWDVAVEAIPAVLDGEAGFHSA